MLRGRPPGCRARLTLCRVVCCRRNRGARGWRRTCRVWSPVWRTSRANGEETDFECYKQIVLELTHL